MPEIRCPTTTFSFVTYTKHNIIIKSKQYYLTIIIQERQYVCKYCCEKLKRFKKRKKKKVSLKNEIRSTDYCAVRILMAGSALVLLGELCLGCNLCTERMFCTPPRGQQEVCCSLEKASLLASSFTFFGQTEQFCT